MSGRFRLEYRPSVAKDLRIIDSQYRKLIFEKINRLSFAPVEKGSLKIDSAKKRYRIRVGIYRVIYRINFDDRIVIVEAIRHRKDVYRGELD